MEVGGISGEKSSVARIENVWNIGNITANPMEAEEVRLAGIVADGNNSIAKAFHTGKISSTAEKTRYFGAIVGDSHTGTVITDCFYQAQDNIFGSQSEDVEGITRMDELTNETVVNKLNENVNVHNQNLAEGENLLVLWKE